MEYRSCLIKPASALCNMSCRYCFYRELAESRPEEGAVMTDAVARRVVERMMDASGGPVHVAFAFQGGEPTLAGLDFFERFVSLVDESMTARHTVTYAVQTNGLLLDDAWCAFLSRRRFLTGVSLDGFTARHDAFRHTRAGKPTHAAAMAAIERLRRHRAEWNVLTVLTRQLAAEPEALYRFYREHEIRYAQLVPCLPPFGAAGDEYALSPKRFADFYRVFFRLWLEDTRRGPGLSVALFDNLIRLLRGLPPSQCGINGVCAPQYVVESDGSVYPCDFYALNAYRCGSLRADSVAALRSSEPMRRFLRGAGHLPAICGACPYLRFCGGNCRRMRAVYLDETLCGYRAFLDDALPELIKIADGVRG